MDLTNQLYLPLTFGIFFIAAIGFSFAINGLLLKFSKSLGARGSQNRHIIRWSSSLKPSLGGFSFYMLFLISISTFGFFNVHGITLYPRLERDFSQDKRAFVEIKYLPLLNGINFGFLPSGNYDFSLKGGYQGFQVSKHLIELFFEVKLFGLTYAGGSTGTIQMNSYTFGVNSIF